MSIQASPHVSISFVCKKIVLTLKSEPGCEKFEVLVPQENNNCIFLYELYTDPEAVEEHMNSDLLASTRGSYDNMITSKRVIWCDVV